MEDKIGDKFKKLVKKIVKKVVLMLAKPILIGVVIISVITTFLASAVYIVVGLEAQQDDGNIANVPYAAEVYQSGITINEDGTITNGQDIQALWDEMLRNGSHVNEYLDSPEELAKLINAEIITSLPDTRPNPDEPINWDNIDLMSNVTQGIIKIKRSDENQNVSTLTYAPVDDFYSWIEDYNVNGNQNSRNNALSHFTIKESMTTSATNNVQVTNHIGNDPTADISQAIVQAAQSTPTPGKQLCQAWVRQVYEKAGLGSGGGYGSAFEAYQAVCVSTERNNIPVGAAVYGTGSNGKGKGNPYGHVGIYIGNGQVMDNPGTYIRTQSLDEWIGWQEREGNVLDGRTGWLGWGWQSSAPSTVTPGNSGENSEESNEETNVTLTTRNYVVEVARWKQVDAELTTNDPNVSPYHTIDYQMETVQINYQQLVANYTLPFDLIWDFLVLGKNKDFAMEFADLAYNSQIEITVFDNYEKRIDEDRWTYTKEIKKEVHAEATAGFISSIIGNYSYSDQTDFTDINDDQHYESKKKVITQTNTLVTAVTKAKVWYEDYEQRYEYQALTRESENSNTVTQPEQDFTNTPDEINTLNSYPDSQVTTLSANVKNNVEGEKQKRLGQRPTGQTMNNNIVTTYENLNVIEKIYSRYKDIVDNVTNTVDKSSYTSLPATMTERTDPNDLEPNFVTIYSKPEYEKMRDSISSVDTWLFGYMEGNPETSGKMVDLIKYLLYKATGGNYGVTTFDFNSYTYMPNNFSNVTDPNNAGIVQGDSIQATVWYSLVNAGYSEIATAAVMGNIGGECDWNPDLIEVRTGAGYGLIQWSFGRRNQLEAFAASRGASPSDVSIQVEFLLGELNPNGGADGYADSQLYTSETKYDGIAHRPEEWKNATSIEEATRVFCYCFERPEDWEASSSMQKRIGYANQAYTQFQGSSAPAHYTDGSIISEAQSAHIYLEQNGYRYDKSYKKEIPLTNEKNKYVDCSSYVSWVLYRLGFNEFGGKQKSSIDFNNNPWGWQEVNSINQAVAGDILCYSGHVEIYAGEVSGNYAKVYNCGTNKSVQNSTPSTSGHTISSISKILRVPKK